MINFTYDDESAPVKEIEDYLSFELMLVKFDEKDNSKYDNYISTIGYKIINITDKQIIEFYDIEVLPTIKVYKNKNLVWSIEGFKTKSELMKILIGID